jgi:hypothetical protein
VIPNQNQSRTRPKPAAYKNLNNLTGCQLSTGDAVLADKIQEKNKPDRLTVPDPASKDTSGFNLKKLSVSSLTLYLQIS